MAIVDPDTIRRGEIVADIKIGCAVPVDIPEHCGQSPIVEVLLERLSFFIQKRASGETHRLKSTVTIIEKKGVSFAVFHDFACQRQSNSPHQVRIRSGPVAVASEHSLAADAIEAHSRARLV